MNPGVGEDVALVLPVSLHRRLEVIDNVSANALGLLGVGAPEQMTRLDQEDEDPQ